MKNINLRILMSAVCLLSIFVAFTEVEAGPIRFDQVVQVLNANPGRTEAGNFTRLRVANYYVGFVVGDTRTDGDDDEKNIKSQDDRVITETRTDIVNDDVCDCVDDVRESKFPKWALLGLAAIPVAFILIKRKKETPTPMRTPTPPFMTPTPTPMITPTPPMMTPTPPPMITPTPPEPVPEPVTILLFGTGLASIGLAARRKFGKKDNENGSEGEGES